MSFLSFRSCEEWARDRTPKLSSPKTLVFSISRGWYIRLFLRSGVLRLLLEETDYRIVILTPAYQDEKLMSEFQYEGRVIFERQYDVGRPGVGDRVYLKGVYALHKRRIFQLAWRRIEPLLTGSRRYDELFEKYEPDMVITASAGLHSLNELPIIREARQRQIPTLCVVWSWDNLSMKGPLPTRPQKLAVWNNMMFDEALSMHYYSPEDVFVTGVPQFDHYLRPDTYETREAFCQKIGFDPDLPIITLATAPMESVADHKFLLRILVDGIEKGTYGAGAQLLCRLHPLDTPEYYSEFLDHPKIKMDRPGVFHEILGWLPDEEEDKHLANTLRHTDVLVNVASTVTIEASIVDTPVISVAFSTSEPERFAQMVLKNHYGNHFKYVIESGASKIVWSEEELNAAIHQYLKEPQTDAEQRRKLAESMIYKLDGASSRRVKDLIKSLVE